MKASISDRMLRSDTSCHQHFQWIYTTALLLLLTSISNAQNWRQLGSDLIGEASSDASGTSVAYSGNGTTVAVGAPGHDGSGTNAGQVKVFKLDGTSWVQMGGDIDGESANDGSGIAVALSANGSTVAIGAAGNDGNGANAGHVRVWSYDGSAWTQLGGDIDGEATGDESGSALAVSDDGRTIAIGAPKNDGSGIDAGHVRIYEYNGVAWVQMGNDLDGEAADNGFGNSVALSADGKTVAVGAARNTGTFNFAGHVQVYEYNGSAWTQLGSDLEGEAAFDFFGTSVSLSSDGQILAAGATGSDGTGFDVGNVRIFEYDGSAWQQLGDDIHGESPVDRSGHSVSLASDGNRVAISSYLNDGNGASAGHVRLFIYQDSNWEQLGVDVDGDGAGDESGYSISLSDDGTRLAIGARGHDGGGASAGQTKVYEISSPEPSAHPTNFVATTNSSSQITVTWTDVTSGNQLPRGYLIAISTRNMFDLPVDGIPQSDDTNYNDGKGQVNVLQGEETYVFTGLRDSVTYFFRIYAYTNSGIDIDYKTDETIPSASATTLADLWMRCPSNVLTTTDAGDDSATISLSIPPIVNNIGSVSLLTNSYTGTENASGRYPIARTLIIFTLTDSATGLTETCRTRIDVTDEEAPTLVLPRDTVINIRSNLDGTIYTYDAFARDNVGFEGSLSADPNEIIPFNSFICGGSGIHTATSYVKVIDRKQDIRVDSVKFGVQESIPGTGFSTQPIIVKLYSLDSALAVSFDHLTLLDSVYTTVGLVSNTTVSVPVSGTIASDEKIVVEVFAPDAFFSGDDHSFFIGADTITSNECYYAAPVCSYTDLVSPSVVLPDVNWAIDAIIEEGNIATIIGSGDIQLVSGKGSGAYFPKGTHIEKYKAIDAYGNEVEGEFTVIVQTPPPAVACRNTSLYLSASGRAAFGSRDLFTVTIYDDSTTLYFLGDSTFDCSHISGTGISGLFFSEYINSDSTDQAYEIYNGTSAPIDLAADDYSVTRYANGDISLPTTFELSGTLAPRSGLVVAHPGASGSMLSLADLTDAGTTTFSGNDLLVLEKSGTVLDVVGRTGGGSAWGNLVALRRKASIKAGDATLDATFDPNTQWEAFIPSLWTNLGRHTVNLNSTQVSAVAVDELGRGDTCTSSITVLDTIAPSMTCRPVTADIGPDGTASVTPSTVALSSSDNCGTVFFYLDQQTFRCVDDLGLPIAFQDTNSVILTAVDRSGNRTQCHSEIILIDRLPPVATVKDTVLYLDASGTAQLSAHVMDEGSKDNCGVIDSIGLGQTLFDCSHIGVNVVLFWAIDPTGNIGYDTASITVLDTLLPSLIAKDTTIYLDANGTVSVDASDLDLGSTDNCAISSLMLTQSDFDCQDLGTNRVGFFIGGALGRGDTIQVGITVLDTIPPTTLTRDINVYLDGTGQASIEPDDVDNGSSDNCAIASKMLSQAQFDCEDIGTNILTLTLTDSSGNASSAICSVTVLDTLPPNLILIDPVLYLAENGFVTIGIDDIDNGSSDACGDFTFMEITDANDSYGCNHVGKINLFEVTAEDQFGNRITDTVTVTVLDTLSPMVIPFSDLTLSLDQNGQLTISPDDLADISDNCQIASQTLSRTSFSCDDVQEHDITITVEDIHGNVTTVSQRLNVVDDESPTIEECPSDTVIFNNKGQNTGTFIFSTPATNDNCVASILQTEGPPSGSDFPLGRTTISYLSTDPSGNVQDCSYSVEVIYVNEQPSFSVESSPTQSLEDQGAVSLFGWATLIPSIESNINPEEAAQVPLGYSLTNISNPGLFAVLPSVDANGTLTYETLPELFGTTTFDLIVQDNGGTENGGIDTSLPQTITLEILPVNDAPTIDPIADIKHYALETLEIPLSGISSGMYNENQNISIFATSDDGAVPDPTAIYRSPDTTATLRIVLDEYFSSPVTITVSVADDGGVENGGIDLTETSFQILPVDIGEEIAFVPTLFTPNGDGNNDVFIIHDNSFFESLSVKVYNREGSLVFSSNDVTLLTEIGWDGSGLPSDNYSYQIKGIYKDGTVLSEKIGQVKLIR